MTKTPLVDRVGLDFDGASDEQRLDMWADIVRPLFDVSLLDRHAALPVTGADAWLVDNIMLTRAAFAGQAFDRNSKHIKQDVADCLLFQVYLTGELHGDIADEGVRIRPGDMHIQDFSRPHRARTTEASVLGLVVPHDVVGYDRNRHPAAMHVPSDGAVGRILQSAIVSTFQQIGTMTKAEAPAIAGGLIGLLRGALFAPLGTATQTPGFAAARSRAVRDFIAQNLRSDRLTASAICAAFGLSRATLYRDFQADGGVDRYIAGRRLDSALMALAFTDSPRGAVGRAAEDWGFSSSSHFIREFQRRFGFSPGSVVGARSGILAPPRDGQRAPASTQAPDLLPLLKQL